MANMNFRIFAEWIECVRKNHGTSYDMRGGANSISIYSHNNKVAGWNHDTYTGWVAPASATIRRSKLSNRLFG